jgi:hypothetical protein
MAVRRDETAVAGRVVRLKARDSAGGLCRHSELLDRRAEGGVVDAQLLRAHDHELVEVVLRRKALR